MNISLKNLEFERIRQEKKSPKKENIRKSFNSENSSSENFFIIPAVQNKSPPYERKKSSHSIFFKTTFHSQIFLSHFNSQRLN